MKKIYLLPLFFVAFCTSVFAQTPEKLSYQAIVRNSSNTILANQPVGVQISILQNSANGNAIYAETQNPSTNANGLINIEIGTGNQVSGNFNTIDWGNNTYFIKTEIDPNGGSSYTITGVSQLLSVPYALHAKTAESISGGITENDPNFTASAASGILNSDIINWNNKLSAEVDGSITNEIELPTGGNDGQVLKTDGAGNYAWVDQTVDTDTNTQLNETQVDAFVANNGYLTAEVDGSVTNEIELPEGGNDGQVLKTDGAGNYAWVDQTVDTDTDTQLNETQVDAFVANNGYLTTVTEDDISGTISMSKTEGLQNALDAKQNIINDGDLTISKTDGLQTALDAKLETEVDGDVTNEIQNLEEVLTESNDANGKNIVNTGQIAIGTTTPEASAALEINSTTGALLLPRMSTAQRDALSGIEGMLIFNTTQHKVQTFISGGNYSEGNSVGISFGYSDNAQGNTFQIANNATLNTISVSIANPSGNPTSGTTTYIMKVYDSQGGSLLATASNTFQAVPGGYTGGAFDFSSSNLLLTANTSYYFEVSSDNSSNFYLYASYSNNYTLGAMYVNGSFNSNADIRFTITSSSPNVWVDLH